MINAKAFVRRYFVVKVFSEITQNSQENTSYRVSFLIKQQVWGLQFCFKKRLWHGCFPMNFAKFLRTPFSIEHLRWLLLPMSPWFMSRMQDRKQGNKGMLKYFKRIFLVKKRSMTALNILTTSKNWDKIVRGTVRADASPLLHKLLFWTEFEVFNETAKLLIATPLQLISFFTG